MMVANLIFSLILYNEKFILILITYFLFVKMIIGSLIFVEMKIGTRENLQFLL